MLNDDLSHARRDLMAIRNLLSQAGVVGPEDVEAPPLPAVEPKVLAPLLDETVNNDPGVRQIEAEIAQWKENIAKIEAAVQPGVEPLPLVRARDALKTTQVRLEKTKADLRPRLEATAKRLALAEAAKKAEQQKDIVANLKRRESAARTQVNELLVTISEKSAYRFDLMTLQKKIHTNEKMSEDLGVMIERLKIDLDAPLRVSVAEEPYIMTGLEANKRLKVTLMGTIGVFVVSFAGLVFWEFRTRRVTNADEVSRALGIRLVGTVPPISSLANTSGRGQAESHAFAEAIDAARTMLLYGCAGGRRLRTVLVTSALAGEGKT